ncbi:hypothetical protein CDEF62S_04546 [Castellaniella defragrans]
MPIHQLAAMPARATPLPADDYDSPWKEALDLYFREALALLVPELHAAIDWSVAPQFLGKELQSISRPGKRGRRLADKLVRVRLRSGAEAWLLVHVEVQGRACGRLVKARFTRRMYEYRYLIGARAMRLGRAEAPPLIYSLGILIDGQGPESHLVYTDEYLGQGVKFSFPVLQLGLWQDRLDELEAQAPSNPFAVVVMAQLAANRYRDKSTRLVPKFELVKRLKTYGYDDEEIRRVYRLVDWMIRLPEDLEPAYLQAIETLTEDEKMTYLTTSERWSLKRSRAEGQAELLLRQIQRRFGAVSEETEQKVRAGAPQQLELWALNILDATTLEGVFRD